MSGKSIETSSFPVPVKIILEQRKDARISLGKRNVIIRLPKKMPARIKAETIQKLIAWAHETIQDKNLYVAKDLYRFDHGASIVFLGKPFTLEHRYKNSVNGALHFGEQGVLRITLPLELSETIEERHEFIRKLLMKGASQLFRVRMEERVRELNRIHFNTTIKKISLRYTTTRWGSCSSLGTISLSSRLLLVPPEVCDYVIIHELAHRFEMNHSHRFWALVEKAMPDFKTKIHWLKKHGKEADF